MNLYKILGVAKDATKQEIRKVYKLKANKMHPDKENGDEESFKQLKHAYEVLFDDERRKRYDTTGSDSKVPDINQEARSQLIAIFTFMVENEKKGDIIKLSKDHIESQTLLAENQKELEEKKLKVFEKKIGRVTSKGEMNLFEDVINQQISNCKAKIVQAEHFLSVSKLIIKLLNDYEDNKPEKVITDDIFTNQFFIQR